MIEVRRQDVEAERGRDDRDDTVISEGEHGGEKVNFLFVKPNILFPRTCSFIFLFFFLLRRNLGYL